MKIIISIFMLMQLSMCIYASDIEVDEAYFNSLLKNAGDSRNLFTRLLLSEGDARPDPEILAVYSSNVLLWLSYGYSHNPRFSMSEREFCNFLSSNLKIENRFSTFNTHYSDNEKLFIDGSFQSMSLMANGLKIDCNEYAERDPFKKWEEYRGRRP